VHSPSLLFKSPGSPRLIGMNFITNIWPDDFSRTLNTVPKLPYPSFYYISKSLKFLYFCSKTRMLFEVARFIFEMYVDLGRFIMI
jgi:hypothetical protein